MDDELIESVRKELTAARDNALATDTSTKAAIGHLIRAVNTLAVAVEQLEVTK